MEKKSYGVLVANIERLLRQHGELTSAEICAELDVDRSQGGAVLSRMNKASPKLPKRIYKVKYIDEHEGQRRYPRSVYALGDLPDAKKPKASAAKNSKRYRLRVNKKVASVFHLGLSRNQKREMRI
jgi:DNA-directed RNA polymerase specialized sigma24 family protein